MIRVERVYEKREGKKKIKEKERKKERKKKRERKNKKERKKKTVIERERKRRVTTPSILKSLSFLPDLWFSPSPHACKLLNWILSSF